MTGRIAKIKLPVDTGSFLGAYLLDFFPQPQPPFFIACEALTILVVPLPLLLFVTFFPPIMVGYYLEYDEKAGLVSGKKPYFSKKNCTIVSNIDAIPATANMRIMGPAMSGKK